MQSNDITNSSRPNENGKLEKTNQEDELINLPERETLFAKILIDSGCTSCVVRKDFLKESKIQSLANQKATLFDGSEMDVLGYVMLLVSYLGKTVELPFYVVAELSHTMLLGTTWIRRSGAILQSDGTELGVTFGGKEENPDYRYETCCPSPCVSVVVDENVTVSALVDTGLNRSSINMEVLTDLQKSKKTTTTSTITIGNGTEMEILGLINIKITFQGITTCLENVCIVSKMNNQLVLGMDWVHKTRAVIQSDGSEIIVSQPDS